MEGVRSGNVKIPFDLVHRRTLWYAISLLVIIPGFVVLLMRGLNLGTDFLGGLEVEVSSEKPLPAGEGERGALSNEIARVMGLGSGSVKVTEVGTEARLLVRLPVSTVETNEELTAKADALVQQLSAIYGGRFGQMTRSLEHTTHVGPVIGKELQKQAVLCLIFGLSLILFYIRQRYNFIMASGAIIALFHDVLVVVGMMAIGRWEINAPFVAALLTIIGYSVHDTVVILDRIRENSQSRSSRTDSLADVVNFSLWQTMTRSINTVVTVILVLVFLTLFGGATIHEFAIAMLIGVTSGAYSSIFNASQIYVGWSEWALRRKAGARASTGRAGGYGRKRREAAELERARRAVAAVSADAQSGDAAAGFEDQDLDDNGAYKPRAQEAKQVRRADRGRPTKSKKRF